MHGTLFNLVRIHLFLLGTHRFVNSKNFLQLYLRFSFSVSRSVAALIGLMAGHLLIRALDAFPRFFPGSFTVGEMAIVLQATLSYLTIAFGCTLAKYIHRHDNYCFDDKPSAALQVGFFPFGNRNDNDLVPQLDPLSWYRSDILHQCSFAQNVKAKVHQHRGQRFHHVSHLFRTFSSSNF